MKKTLLILSALLLTAWGGVKAQTEPYKFVCSEWGSIDTGRVTDANVTYDTEANTITVAAGTGANNVALSNGRETPYTTANYIVTNEQHWFIVVGTNLSTADENASQLWWMNGANDGGSYGPTNVVELSDGQVLLAWDLTTTGIDSNLQNAENYLDGWTGFGLTSTTGTSVISNICFYTATEAVEAYPSLEGVLHDATPYEFVNTDWVGVTNRSATDGQVTYSEEDNTITVAATGANNIALENKYENGVYVTANYTVTKDQCWFVIVGTNLSTEEKASYLWWMDGSNNGEEWEPTEVVELEDGQVLFAWDLSTMAAIDGNLQSDVNNLSGYTCFGLTTTSTSSVISNINFYTFDEMIEAYPETDTRTPYGFVCTDWGSMDLSRLTDDKVTHDETNNTITVNVTGDNNVALGNGREAPYTTANYYVTNEQSWFIVVGTNLSTASGASKLWWMDGANSGEWDPTEVKTLSDGQVLVAWDLSTMAAIDVNLQNEKNTLSGWTGFGLTSTTGTSVISDINFYTEDEAHSMIDGTTHFCTANIDHWSTTSTLPTGYYLRVDTWAIQSDEKMSVPFVEYYADGDAYLPDATICHEQLTDLEPGMYTVSMDIRIIDFAKDGDNNAKIGSGTLFIANDVSEDILTGNDGTEDEYDTEGHDEVYGTYTLSCEVGDAGTLDISLDVKDATYSWIMFKNLSVTYAGEVTKTEISWEMTEAGWGTLILPFAADVPSELTAYAGDAITVSNSELELGDAAESIAANTPYLVSGTEGTYTFSGVATNTQNAYTVGVLTGTLIDMSQTDFTADGTEYVLQNHTEAEDGEEAEGLAFYPITSSSTGVTLGANHCYLIPGVAPTAVHLPGMATGIEAVESDVIANDAIYDLSGRRVAKAVKGVYIQNGKKVLVK